jgi:hypothetical protein
MEMKLYSPQKEKTSRKNLKEFANGFDKVLTNKLKGKLKGSFPFSYVVNFLYGNQ